MIGFDSPLPSLNWGAVFLVLVVTTRLSAQLTPVSQQTIGDLVEEHARLAMHNSSEPPWRLKRCGANTLYMFLLAAGEKVEYTDVVAELPDTQDGASLYDIATAAEHLGVNLMYLRLNTQSLKEQRFPVIAHWEHGARAGGHYVLVTGFTEATVSIIDGTTARRSTLSWPAFQRRWTGYVLIHDRNRLLDMIMWGSLLIASFASYSMWRSRPGSSSSKAADFSNAQQVST